MRLILAFWIPRISEGRCRTGLVVVVVTGSAEARRWDADRKVLRWKVWRSESKAGSLVCEKDVTTKCGDNKVEVVCFQSLSRLLLMLVKKPVMISPRPAPLPHAMLNVESGRRRFSQ